MTLCVTNTEGYVTFSGKGLTWFSHKCSFWYIKNSLYRDWCKQNC